MVSAEPCKRSLRSLVRNRVLQLVAAVGALALIWTLVVGWWLPRFAQPRIEATAAQALGVPLSLGRLEIAPWSLGVTVLGLVLGAPDAPVLKVTRAQADLSVESLWRLAPVLRRVTLTEPQLHIERLAAGRFNFTPVLEALASRPVSPPDAPPSRFAVHNIRLVDGRVDVFDRVSGGEHHVEALQIGVPFVSNLPSQLTTDVEPLLEAQIDGSRLHLKGKTQPFAQGRRSTIAIDWQQLDVAQWAQALTPLLPTPLPLKVTGGESALALQIAFEQRADGQAPLLRIGGNATLSSLQTALPAYGMQLGWERLAVEGLDLQPFAREMSVASVRLQAPQAQVDLPALLAQGAPPGASPKEAAASAGAASPTATAWQWRVGEVRIDDGNATLRHPAWPESQTLSGLTLTAKQLDSRADAAPASLALGVKDGRGASLKLDAASRVAAHEAQLSVRAEGWDVSAWSAPWQPLLPVRTTSGTLAFNAKADVEVDRWAVTEGEATLTSIKLQPNAEPATRRDGADRLDVQRVVLTGFEAGARAGEAVSLKVRSLSIDALDFKAARLKDGALGWLSRASSRRATPASPTEASPASAATPAGAVGWQLGELRCAACAASFTDEAVAPTAVIAITRADITLRGVGDDMSKPIDFELASRWRQGGRLQVRGSVTPQPLALRSRVDVAALDLRMLQPYLRPYVNLELVSAKLDAAGDMSLEGSARSAAVAQLAAPVAAARWRGKLGLNELRTLDSLNQAELLRWKALQLDGAQLAWRADAPLQADLGSVRLQDFYSRVILNADARLNLLDIAKRDGQRDARSLTTPADASASAPASAPPPADPASSAAARPQLRWREIAIGGGTVDFTDNFIRPNYSAKLTDLSGTVAALAWDAPQPAAVSVAGKVDGSAPLEISGSINPLGARLATDITASARGIDITRLTGYAARYAGYGIEKGTLSVKVHYKIAAGQLEADNNLYLDQLTFGDKVDSPNALKLPVQLAVSLLKDRNGVIDLNLPIRGSLDDPQFSIGGVIVKVIVNLITKAITAPFTLLANALGGSGGPALTHVDFAPGSSELSDAGRVALDTLSKALTDRPALRLEATGHADAAQDQAGLQAQYLNGLMRAAKARSTGELPDSVTIAPAERARWLEAAYKAADFKDKPRNLIGLQKGLPAPEMEALLLANAPAGDTALRELADERGNRVKAYLVTKLAPERVLLTASKLDAAAPPPGGLSGPRVDFALK